MLNLLHSYEKLDPYSRYYVYRIDGRGIRISHERKNSMWLLDKSIMLVLESQLTDRNVFVEYTKKEYFVERISLQDLYKLSDVEINEIY